jgi:NAD(P)H-dependent flavin oxidoreductase YrpB (nitropropane dioxygenase family)
MIDLILGHHAQRHIHAGVDALMTIPPGGHGGTEEESSVVPHFDDEAGEAAVLRDD